MPAFFSAARLFFAGVPRWLWIALAAVALLIGGIIWHQHRVHAALNAARKAEDAVWAAKLAKLDKQAQALRVAAERASQAITDNVRKQNDQANNAIAADAAAVRLRGAGAASCRPIDHPRVPAAAGVAGPAHSGPDVAGTALSSDDGLAAVPWIWLTNRAEQSDLDRAEVVSWRAWWVAQSAAWEKMRTSQK